MVHASEGAHAALGPCGTRWASPWEGLEPAQSIDALHEVLRMQPENANRAGEDGLIPADVATRWGSVRVARALVAHGAGFTLAHADEAGRRGHSSLAEYIRTLS